MWNIIIIFLGIIYFIVLWIKDANQKSEYRVKKLKRESNAKYDRLCTIKPNEREKVFEYLRENKNQIEVILEDDLKHIFGDQYLKVYAANNHDILRVTDEYPNCFEHGTKCGDVGFPSLLYNLFISKYGRKDLYSITLSHDRSKIFVTLAMCRRIEENLNKHGVEMKFVINWLCLQANDIRNELNSNGTVDYKKLVGADLELDVTSMLRNEDLELRLWDDNYNPKYTG